MSKARLRLDGSWTGAAANLWTKASSHEMAASACKVCQAAASLLQPDSSPVACVRAAGSIRVQAGPAHTRECRHWHARQVCARPREHTLLNGYLDLVVPELQVNFGVLEQVLALDQQRWRQALLCALRLDRVQKLTQLVVACLAGDKVQRISKTDRKLDARSLFAEGAFVGAMSSQTCKLSVTGPASKQALATHLAKCAGVTPAILILSCRPESAPRIALNHGSPRLRTDLSQPGNLQDPVRFFFFFNVNSLFITMATKEERYW